MSLYMNYVKNLKFDERPDYNFLKSIFIKLLYQVYEPEFMFDWTIQPKVLEPLNVN